LAVALSFIRPEARVAVQLFPVGDVVMVNPDVMVKEGTTTIAEPNLVPLELETSLATVIVYVLLCPVVAEVGNMVAVKKSPSVNVVVAVFVPSVAVTVNVP
jgi:Na+-translocating ferredoxin:NAD+ oxidoreductase RnfA subunit